MTELFTGIIEELGAVQSIEDLGDSMRMTFAADTVLGGTQLGDSIAVNGCCLTVAALTADSFSADVMAESLSRTVLGDLAEGSQVNLERATAAGGRLGGHIVQGHVDGTGELIDRTHSEHWDVLRFSLDESLARYVVEKGSMTVSGVSLTVVEINDGPPAWFSVSLIPETLNRTILGQLAPGDRVNLEVDIIAKYVERLVTPQANYPGARS